MVSRMDRRRLMVALVTSDGLIGELPTNITPPVNVKSTSSLLFFRSAAIMSPLVMALRFSTGPE